MKGLFSLLILFCLAMVSSSIAAQEKLLASDGDKAKLIRDKAFRCGQDANIRIETTSASYYDSDALVLQRLADTARAILSFECGNNPVKNIIFSGTTEETEVFSAQASKSSNWEIQTDPAPLERLALTFSQFEPEFFLLGALSENLEPYWHVKGIRGSYQYDAYERQILRYMEGTVDGDLEKFRDYLLNPNRTFDEFPTANKHYKHILSLIEIYAPDIHPQYAKVYQEVSENLKEAYWKAKIDAIIEQHQSMTRIFTEAENIVTKQSNNEFTAHVDNYLKDWLRLEQEFYFYNIQEAPLYEVYWSAEFLRNIPSTSQEKFPETQSYLNLESSKWVDLLNSRIASLKDLAISTVHEVGSSRDDVTEILETAFALGQEFENNGFSDVGKEVIFAGVEHANSVLKAGLPEFLAELDGLEMDAETANALQEQAANYESLAAEIKAYRDYQDAIENLLRISKDNICIKVLEDAGAWQSDYKVKMLFGQKQVPLSKLSCELYENGHKITRLERNWWSPKNYFFSLETFDGETKNYILEADGYLFIENFSIKSLVDENGAEQVMQEADWNKTIARLILPPPSGVPDENGVRECDLLAADPYDPKKRAQGIDFGSKDFGNQEDDYENFERAIDACIAAVEHDTSDVTQSYQLARLFWYSGETELAKEYFQHSITTNYPAALYFDAQLLLNNSQDKNDFVDALATLERSRKSGYTPAGNLIKELNPDGIVFFKDIPPPTPDDIMALIKSSTDQNVGVWGMSSNVTLVNVDIKECFQTSATDFSCEYKPILRCRVRMGMGFFDQLLTNALQSDCNSVYSKFENFRKLRNGGWIKV